MILCGLSTGHWQLILSGDVRGFKKQGLSLMGGILAMNNRELGLNDVTFFNSNWNMFTNAFLHTDIQTIHHYNLRLGKLNRIYAEANMNRIGNPISFYPLISLAVTYGMNDLTNRTYVKAGVINSFTAAQLIHSDYKYSTHTGLLLST